MHGTPKAIFLFLFFGSSLGPTQPLRVHLRTNGQKQKNGESSTWNLPFEARGFVDTTRRLGPKIHKMKPCDPTKVVLADYAQWRAETGYWIGEYSFYGGNGKPFTSPYWNYPYDAYRGFITGNVKGNAYRQRNVFLYPPQFISVCVNNSNVVGDGQCGVNGNSKVFMADQQATNCSSDPALAGDIEGPYNGGIFDTFTELIGATNDALLYQVFYQGSLFQSQLTTITEMTNGTLRRTRSAQGFDFKGVPSSESFYREFKVTKDYFYEQLAATLVQFNILLNDTCTWIDPPSGFGTPLRTGYTPGIEGCMFHLEQSFEL